MPQVFSNGVVVGADHAVLLVSRAAVGLPRASAFLVAPSLPPWRAEAMASLGPLDHQEVVLLRRLSWHPGCPQCGRQAHHGGSRRVREQGLPQQPAPRGH